MTVKERIIELNTKFQKSYYDMDAGFFTYLLPQMLNDMKALIDGFIEKHPNLENTFKDSLTILGQQYEDLHSLLEMPAPSYAVKDNYLNAMKKNISQALWRFHDNIFRFDSRLLQEVL